MLNISLWIGNICNGLLLGNASIARGLTCCKNSQDMRLQGNHGLQNSLLGVCGGGGAGGKPYLAFNKINFDKSNTS